MATKGPLDPTFRVYSSNQAAAYSKYRRGYSPGLYEAILSHHTATGGKLETVLDAGCGTGAATRDVALYFDRAVGVDPGAEMINQAKKVGGTTKSGKAVDYLVSGAEDVDNLEVEALGPLTGKVDLVTAAMAVHWFDMPRFWSAAAKVLRPSGTVALWTCSSLYCHPSTPNAIEVQRILDTLEKVTLKPYSLSSNDQSESGYATLPLPWTVSPVSPHFSPDSFKKQEWDIDGVLSDGKDYFCGGNTVTLQDWAAGLSTASMVTRWREAHLELAGGEEDCVVKTVRDLARAMGVEGREEEAQIRTGTSTSLLMFKRI